MHPADLHEKLLAVARAHPPSDQVPLAFEKRVTAGLRARSTADAVGWWAHALWRSAAACLGLAILLGAWSLLAPPRAAPRPDLSQQFEQTILAAVNQDTETLW